MGRLEFVANAIRNCLPQQAWERGRRRVATRTAATVTASRTDVSDAHRRAAAATARGCDVRRWDFGICERAMNGVEGDARAG